MIMSRVLIPLADGFEEMEGIILIDVLRRGGVEVVTAGLHTGSITASRQTKHMADVVLKDVKNESFDMILLPGGGPGAKNLEADMDLKEILLKMHSEKKKIGAICAAPNVLRNHGIIRGDDPYTQFPGSEAGGVGGRYVKERIVRTGNITTSVGPGSAFEFALDILEQLEGRDVRNKVEGSLQLK